MSLGLVVLEKLFYKFIFVNWSPYHYLISYTVMDSSKGRGNEPYSGILPVNARLPVGISLLEAKDNASIKVVNGKLIYLVSLQ